jgi:hypothetical protein
VRTPGLSLGLSLVGAVGSPARLAARPALTRKPLWAIRSTEGSNPSPSASAAATPPTERVPGLRAVAAGHADCFELSATVVGAKRASCVLRSLHDLEGAHHVVLLVLEDVAVPDVLRVGHAGRQLHRALVGQIEAGADARDLAGVGLDGVLAAVLIRPRWDRRAGVDDGAAGDVGRDVERPAVLDLEGHEV